METVQHFVTPFTEVWYQADSHELVSFGIFFSAMWLIAAVLETAIKKATQEN